jgi:hypothetical protein
MKVTVGERNDAQLLRVAGASMVARQVIAAIRNRLTHCRISFQSAMTSAMAGSGPIAMRSMPMLRDAAFNLREGISCGIGEAPGAIAKDN